MLPLPTTLNAPGMRVYNGRIIIESATLRELGEPVYDASAPDYNLPIGLRDYPWLVDADMVLRPGIDIVYDAVDHDRWVRLFAGMMDVAEERVCHEVLDGFHWLKKGGFDRNVPTLDEMNVDFPAFTLVPVIGLVPNDEFYKLLSERKFPATVSLRREAEFDYTPFPDLFHDGPGHAPMFRDRRFCDFVQKIGEMGVKFKGNAIAQGLVARLYWYTVEFGLVKENGGLRVYGAGIASSVGETVDAVEAAVTVDDRKKPIYRLPFSPERTFISHYDFAHKQELYFVLNDFDTLVASVMEPSLSSRIEALAEKIDKGKVRYLKQGELVDAGEAALSYAPNAPRQRKQV